MGMDFKKGFFVALGVIAALVIIGFAAKAL